LLAAFDRYAANATGSTNFGHVITPALLVPDNALLECFNQGAQNGKVCKP
jgi:hypothetical protein